MPNVETPVTLSCASVPTEVNEEFITLVPNVVDVRTSVPAILYVFPEAILIFSLDFNAEFTYSQINVFLFATEPIPIPAPSSNKSDVAVVPIPIWKSASSIVVELTINWVPSTYKSPLILTIPLVVPTPTGDGSIYITDGPLIVSVLIPIPEEPVENCEAVIIPVVLILEVVENPSAVVAVDAVPVRPPTKPPVAVIIPVVLTLAVVDNPRAVIAVVAMPTRFPVKLVAVIIPVVLTLAVVDNPRAVVAVDAIPVRPPTKLEAVITPEILTFPLTSNFVIGLVVPIPTSALEVTTNTVPVVFIPNVFAVPTCNLCSGFVVPIPTDEEGIKTLLLKVETPETLNWVTEAIPPITFVETPADVA